MRGKTFKVKSEGSVKEAEPFDEIRMLQVEQGLLTTTSSVLMFMNSASWLIHTTLSSVSGANVRFCV